LVTLSAAAVLDGSKALALRDAGESESICAVIRLIAVRLKGPRDEHRVPVTDDFWPVYERYLKEERREFPDGPSLWVDMALYGQNKADWLSTFLRLPVVFPLLERVS
jgi:hypothetical protein